MMVQHAMHHAMRSSAVSCQRWHATIVTHQHGGHGVCACVSMQPGTAADVLDAKPKARVDSIDVRETPFNGA